MIGRMVTAASLSRMTLYVAVEVLTFTLGACLTGCAPHEPDLMNIVTVLVKQDIRRVQCACRSYYLHHGHWPATKAELAGIAAGNGEAFDPAKYDYMEFQILRDSGLHVRFRGEENVNTQTDVLIPQPATASVRWNR